MNTVIELFRKTPAYLIDHPALLVVTGLLLIAVVVGAIRTMKGN